MIARVRDLIHELRIAGARKAMLRAGSREEQRASAIRMCELIKARSASQVERMERKRGLL